MELKGLNTTTGTSKLNTQVVSPHVNTDIKPSADLSLIESTSVGVPVNSDSKIESQLYAAEVETNTSTSSGIFPTDLAPKKKKESNWKVLVILTIILLAIYFITK